MCCFIHYTDIALRTRTKFYKILDVLEKIIPCYMNVHILIMEVNEWGIILDVFFFRSCLDTYIPLPGIYVFEQQY